MATIELLPHQHDFVFSDSKFCALLGGIGCVHGSTLLDTEDGPIAIEDIKTSKKFKSLDGESFSYQRGTVPYLKGKGDLYRVVHEQGEFVAYGRHLVFCDDYRYRFLDDVSVGECLVSAFCNQPYSTLEPCLLMSLSSGHRLKRIISNCLDDYSFYCHQYGLRPLLAKESVQCFAPLLIGALESFLFSYSPIDAHKDAHLGQVLVYNHRDQLLGHPSTPDSFRQSADQVSALEGCVLTSLIEYTLADNRLSLQYQKMSDYHRTTQLSYLCHKLCVALSRPYTTTKILAIEKHSHDWYWDLTIDETHNYTAHGCVHHNSGKSHAGAVFTIIESLDDKNTLGLITANTYRQLTNATLATIFRVCDEHGINYRYNQNKGMLTIEGANWLTYSLDNYDNLRGVEVGRFLSDEMRDASPDAFLVLLGRLRDRKAKALKGRITTTPNGYDYLYDYFVGDKKTKEFSLIRAKSFDNKFLPDGFIDTLKQSYDEKVYRQEVLGEFVNISQGRIYYGFDRARHTGDVSFNERLPVYVGMDFNVDPMTAVLCQYFNNVLYVFDEIYLKDSNTNQMAEVLGQKYGKKLTIIPDATGKALKTSGRGYSDHSILREYGFEVKSTGNPFRMDRYNTLNNLFEKKRIMVSNKCVKLIRDLEQVGYKEGTNLPDTVDKELTHISDALGYAAWYLSPILPIKAEVKAIKR